MPQFRYRAALSDGTIIQDRTEGVSEMAVRTQLETQGLFILHLEGARGWGTASISIKRSGSLPLREFLVFNQQFLALVKAGLPILKIFDILTERATHGDFQQAHNHVREEIRGGASISAAMACQPKYFSDLYRATIQSGEHTGSLVEVLQRYIAYLKLVIEVREKVTKALAYPLFLVLVGFGVVGFLLAYVIPTFAEVYEQSNAELPLPTQLLLAAIAQAGIWVPWVIGISVGIGIVLYTWVKTPNGRMAFHRISLHWPLVGDIILKSQIIRLSRTLATILAGGIPLLSALNITANAMTNRVFAQALIQVASRVREGMGLGASLKAEAFLPRMTIEMIEVGEQTGSLETMLQEVAEFHEGELDLQLSQLTTWIEPVLLLFMGVMVGGIVIIMYLPIFQLAGTV